MTTIRRGVTEYTVECYSCGVEAIAHEYSMRMAAITFKNKGWGVWPDCALCPDCWR